MFEEFWKRYPRKVGKRAAQIEWNRMSAQEQAEAILAIPKHCKVWSGKDLQYVPHARTWLHQARWEDEIEAEIAQQARPTQKNAGQKWVDEWFGKEESHEHCKTGSRSVRDDMGVATNGRHIQRIAG